MFFAVQRQLSLEHKQVVPILNRGLIKAQIFGMHAVPAISFNATLPSAWSLVSPRARNVGVVEETVPQRIVEKHAPPIGFGLVVGRRFWHSLDDDESVCRDAVEFGEQALVLGFVMDHVGENGALVVAIRNGNPIAIEVAYRHADLLGTEVSDIYALDLHTEPVVKHLGEDACSAAVVDRVPNSFEVRLQLLEHELETAIETALDHLEHSVSACRIGALEACPDLAFGFLDGVSIANGRKQEEGQAFRLGSHADPIERRDEIRAGFGVGGRVGSYTLQLAD